MLALILVSAGASAALWGWQRRHQRAVERPAVDQDAEIALTVARHTATSRGHALVALPHLVFGLLQDDACIAAIEQLGGDVAAIEDGLLTQLAELPIAIMPGAGDSATAAVQRAVHRAMGTAMQMQRPMGCADLWAGLRDADGDVDAMLERGRISRLALLFTLVHGEPEPALPPVEHRDELVQVALRNDDHTTRQLVSSVLHDVFELTLLDAEALTIAIDRDGHGAVGTYRASVAHARVQAVRARARAQLSPLWIGIEAAP